MEAQEDPRAQGCSVRGEVLAVSVVQLQLLLRHRQQPRDRQVSQPRPFAVSQLLISFNSLIAFWQCSASKSESTPVEQSRRVFAHNRSPTSQALHLDGLK